MHFHFSVERSWCPFLPNQGELAAAINAQFGSFDAFCTKFSAQTAAVQGSGWGWLGLNKETGKVAIATTANQDPLSTVGLVPLLGVDVWCVSVIVSA